MKIITTTLLLTLSIILQAQGLKVYFIGHSLVNTNMPRMVDGIAKSKGYSQHSYNYQVINGANLKWGWSNGSTAQGSNAQNEIPSGGYDAIVMTEAVPLKNHLDWSQPFEYATNFHDLAYNANNQVQTYLYETWHCNNSGTPEGCAYDDGDAVNWDQRLVNDLSNWEWIVDSVNMKKAGGNDMLIVPAGQCMKALYDSVQANVIPGIDSIEQFFADDIHMNDLGNYFIACIQFATLYKETPVGANAQLQNEWGQDYQIPHSNATLIQKLQEIAWKVVVDYPRDGVNGVVTNAKQINIETSIRKVSETQYQFNNEANYFVFDLSGKQVLKGIDSKVDVATLRKGIYFIKVDNSVLKIVRR